MSRPGRIKLMKREITPVQHRRLKSVFCRRVLFLQEETNQYKVTKLEVSFTCISSSEQTPEKCIYMYRCIYYLRNSESNLKVDWMMNVYIVLKTHWSFPEENYAQFQILLDNLVHYMLWIKRMPKFYWFNILNILK